MRKLDLYNKRGTGMILALLTMMVICTLGVSFLWVTATSIIGAKRDVMRSGALAAAEAGANQAIYMLMTTQPGQSEPGTYRTTNPLTGTLGPEESYSVCVCDGTGVADGKVVITSTGSDTRGLLTTTQTLREVVSVDVENVNVWNNAIFAGAGQSGNSIDGNVQIAGSVHILGDPELPLTAYDMAETLGGTAFIGNNYDGMTSQLRALVPDPPEVTFNGETVQSLNAKLRVEHGNVSISGTATVGQPNLSGNAVKETMDGVYVTDGFTGTEGASAVYSDNGTSNPYDLPDGTVTLPQITSGSYTSGGVTYNSYMDYLSQNSAVVSGDLNISAGTPMTITDPLNRGSLTIDANGNMTVSGIVYVSGNISIGPSKSTITYSGSGTLVTPNNVYVHCNVLPATQFPTADALGLIAGQTVQLATGSGDAQLTMALAMFAQDEIISNKQNQVAGTMVSNYFEMNNVPSLFQVPSLCDHLPPGMPGASPILVVSVSIDSWQQI